jgi:hypothetical protein
VSAVNQTVLGATGSQGRPEGTSRILTDDEGHLWRVREVSFADASPSLIFESECGFRRVREYPRNWLVLSEVQLFELSWRT